VRLNPLLLRGKCYSVFVNPAGCQPSFGSTVGKYEAVFYAAPVCAILRVHECPTRSWTSAPARNLLSPAFSFTGESKLRSRGSQPHSVRLPDALGVK
jgi:hypothetical protein